jgi:hypothetical protein
MHISHSSRALLTQRQGKTTSERLELVDNELPLDKAIS